MGRNFAPPLNGDAIRRARLFSGLTQLEVQERCAALGVKLDRSGLSYIENGSVKRPAPKVVKVLSEVLGIEPGDMYKPGDGDEDRDDGEPEAA